jgi:hypothetical protein
MFITEVCGASVFCFGVAMFSTAIALMVAGVLVVVACEVNQ